MDGIDEIRNLLVSIGFILGVSDIGYYDEYYDDYVYNNFRVSIYYDHVRVYTIKYQIRYKNMIDFMSFIKNEFVHEIRKNKITKLLVNG